MRRHPYWIALILLVVAVRAALPYVLRPVLEDQISALLNGRIEVDNVDLSLLRGEAVVEGVRIYEGESDGVASFDKLLANVSWTALPSQQAVIEEIRLQSPVVHVVREADGQINLARLPLPAEPSDEAEGEEPEAADEGGGWPAGLSLLALEDATITFNDRTVRNFEEVNLHVDLLQIERAAYGGPIYDQDGKVTLVAEVAGAPLKIEADFASEILNAKSTGNIHLRDLNVGLGSAYTAELLGWSDLRGALDIDLDFASESGDAHSPRIALALRDFLIAVEGESEPALKWDELDIAIEKIDLREQVAHLSEVRLTNPVVRVRPGAEQPLVLLSRMDRSAAAEEAEAEPDPALPTDPAAAPADADTDAAAPEAAAEPAPAEADSEVAQPETATAREADTEPEPDAEPATAEADTDAAEPKAAEPAAPAEADTDDAEPKAAEPAVAAAEPAAPAEADSEAAEPPDAGGGARADAGGGAEGAFSWRLAKLVVEGARLLVEAPEKTLDVGIAAELSGLTSEPGDKGDLAVKTTVEGGTLDVTGELGIAPVSFDGGLDIADLSLPALLPVVPEPRAAVLRAGVARTDLDLAVLVNEGGETPGVDAKVSGVVGLAGLEVADQDPKRFSFKWEDLEVAIDGVDVRGGGLVADAAATPIRIASIALKKPAFRGVRLEDGSIALPAELVGEGAADQPGAAADAVAETEAKVVEAAQAEVQGDPMPRILVSKVRITKGSARIVDRAVRPEAKPGLKTFALSLDGVRMPERKIERLKFTGTGVRGGVLEANGKVDGEATDVLLTIDKYRLVPYDPYAVTFSGYGIRRGMLSIESKIRLQGDDFETHTNVIVHKLGLKNTTGTTEFEDQIGVSVNLALALLKDTEGNIKLDVPVSGNSQGTNVGIGGIVAQQLKRILVNALTSPLKLFGAVSGGDEVGDFAAARITFAKGDQALSKKGRKETEKIAKLLRDRPELAIHLDVKNSLGDVRALQEAVLLEQLRGRESLDGDFAAIRDYLEARSTGAEAELPYHLEPVLDDMLSHRRPPKSKVEALSSARIDVVRNVMTNEFQVRPEQVLVEEELGGGFVDGPAVVEAELGVVEEEDEELDEEDEDVG